MHSSKPLFRSSFLPQGEGYERCQYDFDYAHIDSTFKKLRLCMEKNGRKCSQKEKEREREREMEGEMGAVDGTSMPESATRSRLPCHLSPKH